MQETTEFIKGHIRLTTETKVNLFGITLFRLELAIDCKWGKAGEKGGWVDHLDRISGDAWISGNAWKKSPLQIQGTRHFFNVCSKLEIRIGCQQMSFDDWTERFGEAGKENGYSPEEIVEYKSYIDLAIFLMVK